MPNRSSKNRRSPRWSPKNHARRAGQLDPTQPDPAWVRSRCSPRRKRRPRQHAPAVGARPTSLRPNGDRRHRPATSNSRSWPSEPQPETPARAMPPSPRCCRTGRNRAPPGNTSRGVAGLALCCSPADRCISTARASRCSPSFGPLASTVYGWFGVTLIAALGSHRVFGAPARRGVRRRRRHAPARARLAATNESARVQPLPLLRLTLSRSLRQPGRDSRPRARRLSAAELSRTERLLEPDQRIDAEVARARSRQGPRWVS